MSRLLFIITMLVAAAGIPAAALHDGLSVSQGGERSDTVQMEHGARLELDTLYLDLGLFPADSIARGVMGFRNAGDEDLIIKRVTSECGCTVPGYSSEAIKPGERGEITVKFNGKGREPGSFTKAVRIRSNGVNQREVFFVKGKIKRVYKK